MILFNDYLTIDSDCSFSLSPLHFTFSQDIVSKVLSFSQQRPRALCIMSGTGTVSSVTLRQPASTAPSLTFEVSKSFTQLTKKKTQNLQNLKILNITQKSLCCMQGRFEILSLGGSYLVNEEGGSKSRTGGMSVSLSGPEGHVIGGGIGMLIAASLVQVLELLLFLMV